jgi:hypothetical protein
MKEATRRKDNHMMDFRVIGWGGMDWIHLAQDGDSWSAVLNTIMSLRAYEILGNS